MSPESRVVERRRSPRIAVPPEGGPVSVVGARLLDVSVHGMLIESLVALEQESLHRFRLVIAGEKVDVEARVAVCRPREGQRRRSFGIGMEFKLIPPQAQSKLAQVLEEMDASPGGTGT